MLDKHVLLKSKKIRENHTPFMSKELSKVIMNRLKLRIMHIKWSSRENFLVCKKQKNICIDINKLKNNYLTKITFKWVMQNQKIFCNDRPRNFNICRLRNVIVVLNSPREPTLKMGTSRKKVLYLYIIIFFTRVYEHSNLK